MYQRENAIRPTSRIHQIFKLRIHQMAIIINVEMKHELINAHQFFLPHTDTSSKFSRTPDGNETVSSLREGSTPHVSKRECHQTYIKNPSDFHIEKHQMAIMIYEMEGFETQADKRDLKSFFVENKAARVPIVAGIVINMNQASN